MMKYMALLIQTLWYEISIKTSDNWLIIARSIGNDLQKEISLAEELHKAREFLRFLWFVNSSTSAEKISKGKCSCLIFIGNIRCLRTLFKPFNSNTGLFKSNFWLIAMAFIVSYINVMNIVLSIFFTSGKNILYIRKSNKYLVCYSNLWFRNWMHSKRHSILASKLWQRVSSLIWILHCVPKHCDGKLKLVSKSKTKHNKAT